MCKIIKTLIFVVSCFILSCEKYSQNTENKKAPLMKDTSRIDMIDTSFVSLNSFCKNKPKVKKIDYEYKSDTLASFKLFNKQKGFRDDHRDSILVETHGYKTKNKDLSFEITQEEGGGLIKDQYPSRLKINGTLFFTDSLAQRHTPNDAFYLLPLEFYIISFANRKYFIMYAKNGNIQNSDLPQEPLFIFDITDKRQTKFLFYNVNFIRNINCFCDIDDDGLLNYITSDDVYSGIAYSYTMKNGTFTKDNNRFKVSPNGKISYGKRMGVATKDGKKIRGNRRGKKSIYKRKK